MKLVNVDSNFSVESFELGNKVVEFVHDKETGYNYFNQQTMSYMLDLSKDTVSNHCKKYEKQLLNLSENVGLNLIRLKTSNKGRKTKFYSFDGLTYVVYRSNSDKAMEMRNVISSVLNKMFNVATGKTDIDTKTEKLRNMQEVEQFKSDECFKAFKILKGVDEELANQAMHKHIVHRENAYNCLELLRTKNEWNDCFEVVNEQINGKIDNTRQLTF